jgi:hypothetical protein
MLSILFGLFKRCVPDAGFQAGTLAATFSITSSTKVFHSPHAGHFPSHFGVS